jgi:hypothetical protein
MSTSADAHPNRQEGFARSGLRTPRSAAFAGIVFALLLGLSIVAVQVALPNNPADALDWLTTSPRRQALLVACSLIPFAGIAFLWFVGVIRDRIGDREDRFFASVFLGSGLLFVGALLVAEAMVAGMILTVDPSLGGDSAAPEWWTVTSNIANELLAAALTMAGVFTTATSTLLLRTGAAPRWLGLTGTVVSILLIVLVHVTTWVGLLFPIWVLALSIDSLIAGRRRDPRATAP